MGRIKGGEEEQMKIKNAFLPMFSVTFVALWGIPVLVQDKPISWEMAKQIIQSQNNLAIYSITALLGLAALLGGASWFTNIYLVRRELRSTIKSLESKITIKEKDAFTELAKQIKEEVTKIKKEVEESIEQKMILFDADKARLFAIVNRQSEKWENAASWLATAIIGYAKIGKDKMLRISVDALNENLEKCKELKDKNKERIKECFPFIPEILSKEREQIKEKLDRLPTKSKTSEGEIK